ncbi:MAG TPA: hypothetical protein VNC42_11465, partial [Bradyrhizobium sp.]|nr:hypothetical protein [Bradyrhizobium sp.]
MITITGIGDHLRPEWPITITGIRTQRLMFNHDACSLLVGALYRLPLQKNPSFAASRSSFQHRIMGL